MKRTRGKKPLSTVWSNSGTFALIFNLAVLTLPQTSLAAMIFPPAASTPEEQVQLLLHLQDEVPTLMQVGAEYDLDLFQLLQGQEALLGVLRQNPEFVRQASEKADLKVIRISEMVEKTLNRPTLLPEYKESWEAKAALEVQPKENHQEAAAKLVSEIFRVDPRSLLNGLIQCLPKDEQGAIFKLPPEEQLKKLNENPKLSEDVIKSKFRFSSYPPGAFEHTKTGILSAAAHGFSREEHLARLVYLTWGANSFEGAENLKRLTDAIGTPESKDYLERFSKAALRRYFSLQPTKVSEPVPALTLREVPPYIGILRGFVGGDCSTQIAYPFPYAPGETLYFVEDTKGTLRGYVQLTQVTANGKPALYLHDIVGPYISSENTELIIEGLLQLQHSLGAEMILIPMKDRIHANINYVPIQNVFYQRLGRTRAVPIYYKDADIRVQMVGVPGPSVSGDYDLQVNNKTGVEISANPIWSQRTHATLENGKPPQFAGRKTTKIDALALALAISQPVYSPAAQVALQEMLARTLQPGRPNYQTRLNAANTVLNQAAIPYQGALDLAASLGNPSSLPLADYYKSIEQGLVALGFKLDAEMRKKIGFLFLEGHLRSSDAVTTKDPELRKQSIDFALSMLKKWRNPTLAIARIIEAPDLFKDLPLFRKTLIGFLRNDEEDLTKFEALIQAKGIDLSFLGKEHERISVLLSSRSEQAQRAGKFVQEHVKELEARAGK